MPKRAASKVVPEVETGVPPHVELPEEALGHVPGARERAMRPTFRRGEHDARTCVELHMDSEGRYPYRELVRLGFLLSEVHGGRREGGVIEDGLIWYVLENSSEKPDVQFKVNGVLVRELLSAVGAVPVALWHAHRHNPEPSTLDIEQFPRWLVDIGVIYCIDKDTNVHYDHSGVISSNVDIAHSLASPES